MDGCSGLAVDHGGLAHRGDPGRPEDPAHLPEGLEAAGVAEDLAVAASEAAVVEALAAVALAAVAAADSAVVALEAAAAADSVADNSFCRPFRYISQGFRCEPL